jgi:hypothetical protein
LDSQGGGYDEQRQEGIECGQFTEADYKDKSKYLPICGTNGSKERIKKKDGSGYFTARRIVVNTVSVIAHFDQEAAIKMAQEKEDGLVDLEGNPVSKRTEDNLLNNRITIQDNPCWNIQFTDPSMEVTSTLAHELSEALYPKQSETESRQLEEKFKKEYEAKK